MNLAALFVTAALMAAPAPRAIGEKERGDRLLENGDLSGAREAYDNALKLSPGYAEALNQIGFLLNKQEKRDEAVEFFKKATAADPRFAVAYYNLGATLRRLERFPEAVEAYRAYARLEPNDASGTFGLAEAYRGQGDKPSALAAYERYAAADKDPANQKRVEKAQATAAQLRKEIGATAPREPSRASAGASIPPAAPSPPALVPTSTSSASAPHGTPAMPAAASPTALSAPAVTAPRAAAPAVPAATAAAQTPAAQAAASTPAAQTAAATGPAPQAASPSATSAPAGPPAAEAAALAVPLGGISAERIIAATRRFNEAMQLRTQGQYRESLFALQDAVNADPTNVQVVFELGSAYAILGSFPQAIAFWQRVLSMPTTEANRVAAEESIERARQKMAGAAPSSTAPAATALGSAGAPAPGWSAPGGVASPAQPSGAPAPAAPTAAAHAPLPLTQEAQDAYAKGLEAYGAGRYPEALREFDRAISAKADFAQAFSGRGSTYLARGEYDKALSDYSQAMRLDSTMAYPVFGLAESLTMLGRKSDALRYYQSYAASRAADVQPALQERARRRIAEISP